MSEPTGQHVPSPPPALDAAPAATKPSPDWNPLDAAATALAGSSGAKLGRFTLQRFHARGGLGEVHVAADEELGRNVAIKRIQERYSNEPAARRRFLNEAAITSRLEHPGIVPVYGLVQDERGQPCYAMRFIEGESLFDAIQRFHAKPPDNEPPPKDESPGLSRRAGGDKPRRSSDYHSLAFRQLLQRFVSVCNTIAYAHSKRVIHRDIKPSNIMLGPFGETLVVDWGLARDLVSRVQERAEEPAKEVNLCSTLNYTSSDQDDRLYTQAGQALGTPGYMAPEQAAGRWNSVGPFSDIYGLGATLYELLTGARPVSGKDKYDAAQKAQAGDFPPPRQVQAAVPKALEAICLKAMALRPEDRYQTATQLAADVEHWLADEPASAYAEPWTVRLRRWGRRHRAVVVGAIVALAAIAALATVVAVEREQAREGVAAEQARTQLQKDRATELADLGQSTIEAMTSEKALAALRAAKELTAEQKNFLRQAVTYYSKVTAQMATDEEGRVRQARSYFRIGSLQRELGEKASAADAYRRAIGIQEALAVDHKALPQFRQDLAGSHNDLGLALTALGQRQAAEQAHRRALEIREQLAADFPLETDFQSDAAASLHNLADFLQAEGRTADAVHSYQQAIQRQQAAMKQNPNDEKARRFLATHRANLAALLRDSGQLQASEQEFRSALEFNEQLAAEFPGKPQHRLELARCHNGLATVLVPAGQPSAADREYRLAIEIEERLATDYPSVPQYRQELANSHHNLANLLGSSRQELSTAEQAFRRALAIRERLAADFPAEPQCRQDLARNYSGLGLVLKDMRQWPASEEACRRGLDIQEKLVADFPTMPQYRRDIARTLTNLGVLLAESGRRAAAKEPLRRALAIREQLGAEFPMSPEQRQELAGSYANLGHVLRDEGEVEASLAWFAKAIALLEPVVQEDPRAVRERLYLRNACYHRAKALDKLRRHTDALKDWERVLELNTAKADDALFRSGRAQSLARAGEHAKAVGEANALAEAKDVAAGTLYELASVCAFASVVVKDDVTLREQYAARAVEFLRQAIAKGYKDAARIKQDPDLAPLRQREDFQKLVNELEQMQ